MIRITASGNYETTVSKQYDIKGDVGNIWRLWKGDKCLYVLWVRTNGEALDIAREDAAVCLWVETNGRLDILWNREGGVGIAALLRDYPY